MEETETARIEGQVRSAFPDGVIEQVQVLAYGDDPVVEPGETGIRVLIAQSAEAGDEDAPGESLKAFHQANRASVKKLRGDLPRSIRWIEFRPGGPADPGRPHGPMLRLKLGEPGGREKPADDGPDGLTPVMTRLGAADLAAVDTLITAGIANSRAEVLRWAVGRIRENPAYAKIQDRVREIDQLKAQF